MHMYVAYIRIGLRRLCILYFIKRNHQKQFTLYCTYINYYFQQQIIHSLAVVMHKVTSGYLCKCFGMVYMTTCVL